MRKSIIIIILITAVIFAISCSKNDKATPIQQNYPAIAAKFGATINTNNLINYKGQQVPFYITKDIMGTNSLDNAKVTLGRVLFYDKNLSVDNSISCASCHKQQFAFGDTAIASKGVFGAETFRHSMRLINTKFSTEKKFFWDERAGSLEEQTIEPIIDHREMGFSGGNGRPGIFTLITKLKSIHYYNELFHFVYGNTEINETRIKECLAQFILSIQSFDSKFDAGRKQVVGDNVPFPNFSVVENHGKNLFLVPARWDVFANRIGGGVECNRCHESPEFSINKDSKNNGIIQSINSNGIDIKVTKSPSLRDLIRQDGTFNGPLTHTGSINTLEGILDHYNNIQVTPLNPLLDPILKPNGHGQKLHLTEYEKMAIIAFLKTLSGSSVYEDPRWSDPFN